MPKTKKIQKRSFVAKRVRMYWHYFRHFLKTCFPLWRLFYLYRLQSKIPIESLKSHCYMAAGSGSGKSELLKTLIIYLKKYAKGSTVFVLDPHGDLADETAMLKQHRTGDNLIYLAPDLSPDHTFCINPLDIGEGRHDPAHVQFMSECLTEVFKEIVKGDKNVSANMETLLKAVLSILLQKKGSTFLDLQRFMRDEENADLLEYARNHCSEGNRHLFETGFYDKSLTPTKNALYTKIQSLLASEAFYRLIIGKSTVDIAQLMDSKKTVVFKLSKGLIGLQTMPAFGRLLMGMIQGYSFKRQHIPKHQRIPVFTFVDELKNFITPSIESILAESRKYAVHLTLVQQFHGQGSNTNLKEEILNNTAVKIAGKGEGESLTTLSKIMIGTTKEQLQNLEKGHFYVKVQPETIAQQHLTGNQAQWMQNTTKYLGTRHAMTRKEWERVKAKQKEQYYRPIKADQSQKFTPEDENYQKINQAAQNAKYDTRRYRKPLKPGLPLP